MQLEIQQKSTSIFSTLRTQ